MKRLAGLALALTALMAGRGVSAQEADAAGRYAAINKAVPVPPAMVVHGAIEATQSDCMTTDFTLGPVEPVTAWGKIAAAIAAGQLSNAWAVTTTRVSGCAPDQTYGRYILLQAPDGALSAQFLHPGRSRADIHDLTDGVIGKAMQVAANTAGRDVPGCSPEMIGRSVRFLGIETVPDSAAVAPAFYGAYREGAWREMWRFGICGRVLTVFVDFTATEDGVKATPASWASLKR